MVREKKTEKILMPEEKLTQALVPIEEQPYSVPENWCWTRIGNISKIVGGGTPSSSVKEYYEDGTIPWITPADLSGYNEIYISSGEKNITELGLKKSSAKMLPANTVCLSSRAPIGYVVIAKNELCTNQGFKSFLPSKCYTPKYLYWYLKGNKELLESYASGTTFLELSGSKAATVELPLAPLPEQWRIVNRIESLFAKLDEAKEKAQAVMNSFETCKAAILHKAFAGGLTKKWREKHNAEAKAWSCVPLEKAFTIRSGKTIPAENELGSGKIPYVKVADMNLPENQIQIITSSRFVDEYAESHAIPYGSTIFPKRGGAISTNKKRFVGVEIITADLNTMAIIPKKDMVLGWYGYYWMQSVDLRELNNGSNVPQINNKDMVRLELPIPDLREQAEIVRILDDFFAKAHQVKEISEVVMDQIDFMKKSILARAFRGELGTNDPAEESAVELLKDLTTK